MAGGSTASTSRKHWLTKTLLSGADAEFLLQRCRDGKLKIRVGQVLQLPKLRGQTTLLCDYDEIKKVSRRAILDRLATAGVRPMRIELRRSPSGRGLHGIILVRGRFTPAQQVALQLIAGSDPYREAQNFRRSLCLGKRWGEKWNVLFTKKEN